MKHMIKSNQQGFTLPELMIALVLGLLIVAAVIQVYFISTRTAIVQESGSNVLDANVFGLQRIEDTVRMVGLGLADLSSLNTPQSGILIKSDANNTQMSGIQGFNEAWMSMDGASADTTNTKGTGSDQLTIQYRAPADMRDCEGKLALGPRTGTLAETDEAVETPIDGHIIIERYFVKRNSSNNNLELRCDAGRYVVENITKEERHDTTEYNFLNKPNTVEGMGDDGVAIINNIDDFKIRLGSIDQNSTITYKPVSEFVSKTPSNAVVSIQMAILAKGNLPTNEAPAQSSEKIFGKNIEMKDGQGKYIRRVYESTVMLRNSRDAVASSN